MEEKKTEIIKMIIAIVVTVGFAIFFRIREVPWYVEAICFAACYLIIGFEIIKEAVEGILDKEILDENFLMTVATIGAFCLGEYMEAVMVVLLYKIGELFEDSAVEKSRDNVEKLMNLRTDVANICGLDGTIKKVSPEEVKVGSVIIVYPGEKVPIDGRITEGSSVIDMSALTGESLPATVNAGDEIHSGAINLSGLIKIETTKEYTESTVARIMDLVENVSSKKSQSERFIKKFAKKYTPIVCILALLVIIIPPIFNIIAGKESMFLVWLYRGLTFLVISCPCALVISIPLAFMSGIGRASKEGVLIKGSGYMEALSRTGVVCVDKTGTITKGTFKVTDIVSLSMDKKELLKYAAILEAHSKHPIAKSVVDAYETEFGNSVETLYEYSEVSKCEEESGKGLKAFINGQPIAIGNAGHIKKCMDEDKITGDIELTAIKPESEDGIHRLFEKSKEVSGTVLYIEIAGKFEGYIVIKDEIKENSQKSVTLLKALGVKRVCLLTGDRESVAQEVSKEVGIDECYAGLLPEGKVEIVEELLNNKKKNSSLIFAGDGINDAPVLMRADIGVAMGALGSDAAIESADVVIMDDNPVKIPLAIEISRGTMKLVYENICFSIAVKVICLILSAMGFVNMWMAIFADVGVMVIAVLNSMRVLFLKESLKMK